MALLFTEVDLAREMPDVIDFLCAHEWPFHSTSRLTPAQVEGMTFGLPSARSFWIRHHRDPQTVGLLRVLDLEDLEDGSVIFDLRIAPSHRGRGVGRAAVRWMLEMLFTGYPNLHRVEATIRVDNAAMRHVVSENNFRLEGLLRETWPTEDGRRLDTALYGILRGDWARSSTPESRSGSEDTMADKKGKKETVESNPELMARHKSPKAKGIADDDLDIELLVRHNRPMADIDLMVRHNRPKVNPDQLQGTDDDEDVQLMVRHNRPMADMDVTLAVQGSRRSEEEAAKEPLIIADEDVDVELFVRHNRPIAEVIVRSTPLSEGSSADDDEVRLMVRHNRRVADSAIQLEVRHTRPL